MSPKVVALQLSTVALAICAMAGTKVKMMIRTAFAVAVLFGTAAFGYDIHTKALTPVTEKAVPDGAPMKFVDGGSLDFVIVGDFGAERTQNTRSKKSIAPAAEFLVEAFERTTGKKPVVLDASETAKIEAAKYWLLVGDSKYARDFAGLDWSKMPEHGYEIKTFARGIAIVGFDSSLVDGWHTKPFQHELSSTGTQYGALDFCERFLGVRHYFPGEYGSLWPKCSELTISPVHYADAPYFATHGNSWHYWVTFSSEAQMAKWRKYMGDGVRLRDTSFLRYWRQGSSKAMQGSHSPEPISYAAAHPDRLKDIFYTSPSGKFWYNPGGHVGNFYDVTNLKFADLLVEDWKKMYATGGKYRPGKLHEYMTDTGVSFGVCDTYMPLGDIIDNPTVRELNLIRDSERKGPERAAMRNVFGRFFQYLGNSLERELPGKELWLLIYYNSLYATNDPRWKLPPNINIWLCLGDMPRKLPSASRTTRSLNLAKEWYEALGGRPAEIMWLYNSDRDPFQRAVIPSLAGGVPKAFGKYFGRRGMFFDWGSGANDLWHNFQSAYALEKAQWNPDFDVDAAMEEHWIPFFGPKAGPHLKAFRKMLLDLYVKYAVPSDSSQPQYPMDRVEAMERELKAAVDATEPSSAEGRRVRLVADYWEKPFETQRALATYKTPVYDVSYNYSWMDWASLKPIPLIETFGIKTPPEPIFIKLAWDEKGLYGRFESKISPLADKRKDVFTNDSLEFIFSPYPDSDVVYQLVWDSVGQLFSKKQRYLPIIQPPDLTWKADGHYWRPQVTEEGLFAEFFVPFSSLGDVKVKPGDVWPANLVFTASGVKPRIVRGNCMTFHNNHNIPMFGRLRFCEKP